MQHIWQAREFKLVVYFVQDKVCNNRHVKELAYMFKASGSVSWEAAIFSHVFSVVNSY